MKKFFIFLLIIVLLAVTISCGNEKAEESSTQISENTNNESSKNDKSTESPEESDVSQVTTDPNAKVPLPGGIDYISNLNHDNDGLKMGDNDGPAYVVYSKIGYNKSEMDIAISQIKINNIRDSDSKFVNAYMFLGADVYSSPTGWWTNCFDTGFCFSGKNGGWHLFYNIYEAGEGTTNTWYESKVILDSSHDYKLVLDTSEEDGKASVYIYDITDGGKLADSVEFYAKGLIADGSNTSYLMNFALDYPQNTKIGMDGNASDDWVDITLYNSDENLYIQNILVTNAKLYKSGEALDWDESVTDHHALWPDMTMAVDYEVTIIINNEKYTDFRVDLDMNR